MSRPPEERILARLTRVYGPERAPGLAAEIGKLAAAWRPRIAARPSGWDQRDALLITYADSLLGQAPPLRVLGEFLERDVGDLVTMVHLLPFYPYSSDDGFAVEDFRRVREDLGGWEDVAALAGRHRLVFDAVINHVSASGVYMRGYASGEGKYADFFIALPPGTDTSAVLRTRDLPLAHEYDTVRGRERLWTTFGPDQVDLDYSNPRVLLEILDVLLGYAARGAAVLRLDAIPYLWKSFGTSCAHLPETHEIIRLIRDVLDVAAPHVLLLTETNVPHRENVSYFGNRGDEAQLVYNFSLPPLILHAICTGNAEKLTAWARTLEHVGPRATYLNVTATHDGIGMRPAEGLLEPSEIASLAGLARARGAGTSGRSVSGGPSVPYELNVNWFDALNDPAAPEPPERQVARFAVSQAVPLAMAGLPGVYVHSLLGSRGDVDGARRTGRARSVNRRQLRLAEVRRELADGSSRRAMVFEAFRRMLSVRRGQSAFHPDAGQEVLELDPRVFALRRRSSSDGGEVLAVHNLSAGALELDLRGVALRAHHGELLSGALLRRGELGRVPLAPYQSRWLAPLEEAAR